jgi:thiamine biosynthesis protein ThiS
VNLIINSEARELPGVDTIPEVLEALGLPSTALLIEHNGTALHRSEWTGRALKEGDSLWFLRIAAGG